MIRSILAALVIANLNCNAGIDLEGEPFTPAKQVEVVWSAPTNDLPKTVMVYRTVPAIYSPAVISNLLTLTGFREKDRTSTPGSYPVDDKNLIHFEDKEKTRFLNISSKLGYIEYYDGRARTRRHELTNNVPEFEKVQSSAIKLLEQLGIDRSELATKPDSTNILVTMEHDKRTWSGKEGSAHTQIDSRGVYFTRRLNGISFVKATRGGARIVFAGDGRLAHLQVGWRNVQPYKEHQAPTHEEIATWIKQGKGVLPLVPINLNLSGLKKLTVTRCVLRYFGDLPDNDQEFIYPFAQVEMTADLGGKESLKLEVHCPILQEK